MQDLDSFLSSGFARERRKKNVGLASIVSRERKTKRNGFGGYLGLARDRERKLKDNNLILKILG